ncbi:predicted protein, partial [Nematostella vectensis]
AVCYCIAHCACGLFVQLVWCSVLVHSSLCRWSLGTACVVQCVSAWLIRQGAPRYSLCSAVCWCMAHCAGGP